MAASTKKCWITCQVEEGEEEVGAVQHVLHSQLNLLVTSITKFCAASYFIRQMRFLLQKIVVVTNIGNKRAIWAELLTYSVKQMLFRKVCKPMPFRRLFKIGTKITVASNTKKKLKTRNMHLQVFQASLEGISICLRSNTNRLGLIHNRFLRMSVHYFYQGHSWQNFTFLSRLHLNCRPQI